MSDNDDFSEEELAKAIAHDVGEDDTWREYLSED